MSAKKPEEQRPPVWEAILGVLFWVLIILILFGGSIEGYIEAVKPPEEIEVVKIEAVEEANPPYWVVTAASGEDFTVTDSKVELDLRVSKGKKVSIGIALTREHGHRVIKAMR